MQRQNSADMQFQSVCQKQQPAFKSKWDGVLTKSGDVMNWIENGGFLVLFLIQDFLGMTVPRTFAGFLRDKEVTGEYNIQEGFEVLGRESITGPSMMAVAPLSLWLASPSFQVPRGFGDDAGKLLLHPLESPRTR